MESRLVEHILRRAISQGGSIGYNPDMYDFGFADNIPPSEMLNNELRKFGQLKFQSRFSDDGFVYGYNDVWSSFVIDERGRQYIKELDKAKDGSFKIKKILRYFFYSFLFGFCLPLVAVLGVEIALAWLLCDIDPLESYSWLSGLFHGLFIIPNYIRHLLYGEILFIADNHTTAYLVCYIISASFIVLEQIKDIYHVFRDMIKEWNQA